MADSPKSNELLALEQTAANLEASIAARDAENSADTEFAAATNREKARLSEIKARIAELTPSAQQPAN